MSPITLYLFMSPSTPPKSPGYGRCATWLVECLPGRRVNKPIWNAPSCPSALPNRSLFIPQGLLYTASPRFSKGIWPFLLFTFPSQHLWWLPLSLRDAGRRQSEVMLPVLCLSYLTVPGTSPYTVLGFVSLPQ